MSVHSFLKRVDELCEARGVAETQLFRGAINLFSGQALTWLRAAKYSVGSWSELVHEIKREFLPPNYDDLLWIEVRRRTQSGHESIGVYVAVRRDLFKRLEEEVSEKQMLGVVTSNPNAIRVGSYKIVSRISGFR